MVRPRLLERPWGGALEMARGETRLTALFSFPGKVHDRGQAPHHHRGDLRDGAGGHREGMRAGRVAGGGGVAHRQGHVEPSWALGEVVAVCLSECPDGTWVSLLCHHTLLLWGSPYVTLGPLSLQALRVAMGVWDLRFRPCLPWGSRTVSHRLAAELWFMGWNQRGPGSTPGLAVMRWEAVQRDCL